MAGHGRGEIVALGCFIEAIRDAGYRGPGAALAELIDNSWEAGASEVHVSLHGSDDDRIVVVHDNGHGMSPAVLRLALQFGGTTRFDSRRGFGRYGMGLPAASLSQAQHVDVYSWTALKTVWWSCLDVDEVRSGQMTTVPPPTRRQPGWSNSTLKPGRSGTVVVWSRCDRLTQLAAGDLEKALRSDLGRVFREQLWAGRRLFINGRPVDPIDPLFLRPGTNLMGAVPYGTVLDFPLEAVDDRGRRHVSRVSVQFVELPIETWHGISNQEKRGRGISKGAGVSVLRAGRELDIGWFFMGTKRKENYDDWWRCEVRFEPELDELFGVSHTKQGIRPTRALLEVLTPDMERIAHDLNRRVRTAFLAIKQGTATSAAVGRAGERDLLLEPPRGRRSESRRIHRRGVVAGLSYRITEAELEQDCFFEPRLEHGEVVLTLNRQHAFVDQFLQADGGAGGARQTLELLLLAAARAEVRHGLSERDVLARFRQQWSNALTAFLS